MKARVNRAPILMGSIRERGSVVKAELSTLGTEKTKAEVGCFGFWY